MVDLLLISSLGAFIHALLPRANLCVSWVFLLNTPQLRGACYCDRWRSDTTEWVGFVGGRSCPCWIVPTDAYVRFVPRHWSYGLHAMSRNVVARSNCQYDCMPAFSQWVRGVVRGYGGRWRHEYSSVSVTVFTLTIKS